MRNILIIAWLTACAAVGHAQQEAAHFDMTVRDGLITESVSQATFPVVSRLPAFSVEGVQGEAMRFDGYSNYVKAALPENLSASALTFSIVLAAETYPMMNTVEAEVTPGYATVAGNLDETEKTGFALQLSSQGDLRFRFASQYANGFMFTINGNEKLKRGRWHVVTAVIDKDSNQATLYMDGRVIGSARMGRSGVRHSSTDFFIGKDASDLKSGMFLVNTFCGIIDDIVVYNDALQPSAFIAADTLLLPDFNYPASRYSTSLWRPRFHAMPSGGWTNETHGMTYADGRWHLFFQKNANGPYMARLHWGHLSSPDLIRWHEEPIALAPDESYDIKGCWSGCVYEKDGKSHVLYTAVDNARAVIAGAMPTDDALAEWQKTGILVNGRPQGLSDDFRDPYYFKANGQEYMIVGTSKNGVGCCTLHRLSNGSWTNDGTIFFAGQYAGQHGAFWEMPTMTDMGNGKWLFTCTPLGMASGVKTIYWTGTVSTDGKFIPDNSVAGSLEMSGVGREGYGLLSPTIYQKDGKTILLGIVPDKLPAAVNDQMGWAHNYSLPREISIDGNGTLMQKPYEGLSAMRSATSFEQATMLSGTLSLAPVRGRQVEIVAEFTVRDVRCGINFLKSGSTGVSLTYHPQTRQLILDCSTLDRQINDNGVYDGKYILDMASAGISAGSRLLLHVFMDGSIADVFVNDRWAFSVRIFPTGEANVDVEAFADAETPAMLRAWVVDAALAGESSGIKTAKKPASADGLPAYDLQGRALTSVPSRGIYISQGKKYVGR